MSGIGNWEIVLVQFLNFVNSLKAVLKMHLFCVASVISSKSSLPSHESFCFNLAFHYFVFSLGYHMRLFIIL